ncbi:hypothetical protein MLD38_028059 [Melastoma candidum]|uniref:Uncharacterized protein n=1 Tax=Melastoma candidum TaxID=119954 RepID=A0ACB9N279_9MYRT|nr:hypothetical protein MLD38_028059 [Melastoma candidum]
MSADAAPTPPLPPPGTALPVRVQSLSQSDLPAVPPEFIQPPDARPSPPGATAAAIPTIDLADGRASLLSGIASASEGWGAFHVINHGVPLELLDRTRQLGLHFFDALPTEEKLKYACDPTSAATEGYGSRMLENDSSVLDWRDYFDHHTLPLCRCRPSNWPDSPPDYRKVIAEYSNEMSKLASKLLGLISESLGLPSSCIEDAVGEFYQNITISYYPRCPQPELTLGLQSHSDMGSITLLIQDDVGGLEVLKGDEWVMVEPLPGAIVVLLADQTEILTNGMYKSAVHRAVTNARRSRLSIATFHDPSKAKTISPIPELVSTCRPPRYREVVYSAYVSSWYTKGPDGRRNIDALLL